MKSSILAIVLLSALTMTQATSVYAWVDGNSSTPGLDFAYDCDGTKINGFTAYQVKFNNNLDVAISFDWKLSNSRFEKGTIYQMVIPANSSRRVSYNVFTRPTDVPCSGNLQLGPNLIIERLQVAARDTRLDDDRWSHKKVEDAMAAKTEGSKDHSAKAKSDSFKESKGINAE